MRNIDGVACVAGEHSSPLQQRLGFDLNSTLHTPLPPSYTIPFK